MNFVVKCIQKWHGFLTKFKPIYALVFFARKICRENPNGSRADVIKRGLSRTTTLLKIYGIGVTLCISSYAILPLQSYFVNGEMKPILPFQTIFCDMSTLSGYLSASFVHLISGLYGGLATIMYASFFLVCICYYTIQADLIGEDLKDLDKLWAGKSTASVAYRHAYLKNICMKIQDMHTYVFKI